MQPVIHVSSSSDTHVKSGVAVHLASMFPRVGGVAATMARLGLAIADYERLTAKRG